MIESLYVIKFEKTLLHRHSRVQECIMLTCHAQEHLIKPIHHSHDIPSKTPSISSLYLLVFVKDWPGVGRKDDCPDNLFDKLSIQKTLAL